MKHLSAYLSLARFDNWTKNFLMFAGVALAYLLAGSGSVIMWSQVFAAFFSLCFASSANYVLNESIDARFDRYHPLKKNRAAVQRALDTRLILAEYVLFASLALVLAYHVHSGLAAVIAFYLFCAWIYNIPPLRFKDIAYLDVINESINYPLRILIGWFSVMHTAFPPSSIIILGWTIGGFTMSVKRLAEYQLFQDKATAVTYRKSYQRYDISKLACISLLYAMLCAFSIAVFLIKYRIEFILVFPFISLWFMCYLSLGMNRSENAVYPERLFKQRALLALTLSIVVLLIVLAKLNLPWLHILGEPLYFG